MELYVVSNQPSRRTDYFIRAGESLGQTVRFLTYEQLLATGHSPDNRVVKLEPPVHNESGLLAYTALCREYISLLEQLKTFRIAGSLTFINSPEAILHTLDKVKTKQLLSGLQVTPVLLEQVENFDALETFLTAGNHSSVFLKPRFGSGAGGVMAIRIHPRTKEWIVYTPLNCADGVVRNCKHIRRITAREEIIRLVNTVCRCSAMVEQWIPKEKTGNQYYDLRVVCHRNKVQHIVVRCSKGTITNLHLNNQARSFAALALSGEIKEKIHREAIRAVKLCGLRYGGVDILIRQGTGIPCIIEVNGQGDHIYEDMFNENNIYRNQIKEWIR